MYLNKIYTLIFQWFAYLQQSLFVGVFDAYILTLSFRFPILITFSNPSFVLYASDEIWLLGKNNFDSFSFCYGLIVSRSENLRLRNKTTIPNPLQ